jgi:hypothetical protein
MHPRPIIDLSSGEDKRSRAREGETEAIDYDIICAVQVVEKGETTKARMKCSESGKITRMERFYTGARKGL